MKTDFTTKEAESFIEFMKNEYDMVRLVDPVSRIVKCIKGEELENEDSEICHSLWGRCERCENCTSLRALQTHKTSYKMELLNGRSFWVESRYICIEGKPLVAEIVTDVTENLIMDSNRLDDVGKIINSYNHLLITDALTGTYNRRFLDEQFVPSLKCCHDGSGIVNIAILDMDDFKHVNDTYGHQAGDLLLKDVAGFWRLHFDSREKGEERFIVRFGGDEMIIISCGNTFSEFKSEIARDYSQMRKICFYKNDRIPFSITFGIASSYELKDDWSWEELFELADDRLYSEKSQNDK